MSERESEAPEVRVTAPDQGAQQVGEAEPEQPAQQSAKPEPKQPARHAKSAEPAEPEPVEPEVAEMADTPASHRFRPAVPSGAKRLWRAMTKRPQASHVGVGALVFLLGFAAVVQVRGDEEDALANARRDELLQIYDGLSRQGDRLEEQIRELRSDREDLISSADSEGVALEQAQERSRQLEIIAGTAPATGPGIQLTISDPEAVVHESRLLAAVMELRSADAEAIQIEGVGNGEAVRVVANTYFQPADEGVIVSGVLLEPTYVITAIGEPESLDEAMNFPGGVVRSIEEDDAEATVTQFNELTVDTLHEVEEPDYVSPAPEDE